jgi:hypothetical protein
LSGFAATSGPGRPPGFAAFAARADGRSFATGAAFDHAFGQAGPGWPAYTITVHDGPGGPPVAALTARLERRFGGRWLRAMPFGAPAGPLFEPSLSADQRRRAAACLWEELSRRARLEGWLGGDVTYSGPARTDPALRAPAALGRERADEAHVVDVSAGPAAWLAGLRKRARQQFTKAERLGVTAGETKDPADLAAVHAHHAAQAAAWGVRDVRPLAFYRALFDDPSSGADGGPRLWVARAEGRVVCGVLGFVDRAAGETYVWWSGSSVEARPLVAFPYVLSRLIAEAGTPVVSLGFSGRQGRLTDFKEQMGAHAVSVPILELTPRPRTPWHALLAGARERLRPRPVDVAPPQAAEGA